MPMTPLIFLKSERSFFRLLQIVHKYELGSGAKLNTTKSEAMWLGRWRANGASPFGLKWVKKMKILGVYFSNGLVSVEDDNWKAKLTKLKSVLGLWSQRDLSFLGRAMIVNVLGASRFWHLAKVLPPPSWVSAEYDHIVWPFIWRSKSEAVSRKRCCSPLSKGGLNIVDFDTKCISLRLSNFSSLRDSFGTCKWHYLARYFISNRLFKFDCRFNFYSNSIPSSPQPSLYYQRCLTFFTRIHGKLGFLPDDLSCKFLYSILLDSVSAIPRSAGFWGSVVGRPINRWAWVWRKSRLKLIENKKNDLLWLILHRAVRVRYLLKRWSYIDNDKCAVCSGVESIEHCFLECPRVVRVWNFFAPYLSLLLDSPFSLTASFVFFPFSNSQSSPGVSLSSYLIATVLFWVWRARNLSTFHNSKLDSKHIISNIINDLKIRIRCQSIDSVRHFWSLRNVFCSVDEAGKISFPSRYLICK